MKSSDKRLWCHLDMSFPPATLLEAKLDTWVIGNNMRLLSHFQYCMEILFRSLYKDAKFFNQIFFINLSIHSSIIYTMYPMQGWWGDTPQKGHQSIAGVQFMHMYFSWTDTASAKKSSRCLTKPTSKALEGPADQ